jgi:hypothetical protein
VASAGLNVTVMSHQWGVSRDSVLLVALGLVLALGTLDACGGPTTAAQARSLCQAALGSRALNSAPGTVEELRTLRIGPGLLAVPHAFPRAAANQVIGLCWTGKPGNYELYAVANGYEPLRVEGLGGKYITTTPGPGTVPIP